MLTMSNTSSPRGHFTAAQNDVLLQPIRPQRVFTANGHSHVAAFDVTAHLTRMFGFDGWDKEILSLDLLHERVVESEQRGGKYVPPRCWVTYRCLLRLTIYSPDGGVAKVIEDAATGTAQNMPGVGDAHDFAIKNAISYAVKRCAKDLGDQFGLSLYHRGATGALVGKIVMYAADTSTVDEHVQQIEGEGVDPETGELLGHAATAAESDAPVQPKPEPKPVASRAKVVQMPVSEAKLAVLEAVGGDKDAARRVWEDADFTVIDNAVDEAAVQRVLTGVLQANN